MRQELAGDVERAIRATAEGEGAVLRSLIVQFVSKAGVVVEAVKFDGEVGEAKGAASSGASGGGSAGGTGHSPVPPKSADGHRPIRGLDAPGPHAAAPSGLAGVGHIIAVGAGKGGVGKSTVAVNLAVGLARRGHAVGLLDGDIYGPSLPTMLGLGSLDQVVHGGRLQPFAVHGIKAVTIGKMVDPEKPLIWRGPMAHGAFKQLTEQTSWGELDYLIVDLPPGTGDVALTMAQTLKCTGAVIVCTPQRVAQDDAVRAARMFQQLGIDVLGVVENMSYFVGDDGKEYDIFGRGGAEHMAQRLGVPYLGGIPITMSLRENSDAGDPTENFEGAARGGTRARSDELLARSLEEMVDALLGQVSLAALRRGAATPTLKIS
ncbi:MAG: Mrp/NBP35 family ATP-binding protein [Phycisphaeraceae bacterium]|nr:Mrp/NBP35 family ATP-binding protein [Phycisphaeraceae bacterium]